MSKTPQSSTRIYDSLGEDITGLASSSNQTALLTELQLKADLTEVQPVFDEGSNTILREILESTNIPIWYDPTTNRLQVTTVGTLTTVTTVTGLTNIGGDPAAGGGPALTHMDWSTSIRSLLV